MVDILGPNPILRSFDEAKARAFYADFPGFETRFEPRFARHLPLYLGLWCGARELHLSKHHGDTTPGTRGRIEVCDLAGFADELAAKAHHGVRVGAPEFRPWGDLDLILADPFGNRPTFGETPGA